MDFGKSVPYQKHIGNCSFGTEILPEHQSLSAKFLYLLSYENNIFSRTKSENSLNDKLAFYMHNNFFKNLKNHTLD